MVLSEELRDRLDELPLRRLADYLAERLDWQYRDGTVELVFAGGNLARAFLKAGPIRVAELEELAQPRSAMP